MRAGKTTGNKRCFLFLQGPHGPFFSKLSQRLALSGVRVMRLGFNRADRWFWRGSDYIAYQGTPDQLGDHVAGLIAENSVTDLVCYGSSRPIHQAAIAAAKAAGLTVHVFEEGYLRPYWVTYERGGANAASPVAQLALSDMQHAMAEGGSGGREVPATWGDMRAHVFWGALYHAVLMTGAGKYPGYQPHRSPGVRTEFLLHFKKLVSTPYRAILAKMASTRVIKGDFPYHLVLLQLAHDANFLDHGAFADQASFLRVVFRGFAEGAPAHHHLVLKAHPLEDGREPLRPLILDLAREFQVSDRVHFISGGKLASLLDHARTAITVNSTAAEQALWRALPLRAFGNAVYNRPEFVSDQPLAEFFRNPKQPDLNAYLTYRAFLLATSQVPGGFYGLASRKKLLREIPDLMLADESAYERLLARENATSAQHLRVVST